MSERKSIRKQFTPEEIAKALGFPEGSRVIAYRRAHWEEKWEVEVDFGKGTLPKRPPECSDLKSYAEACRDYVRGMYLSNASDGKIPCPDKPIYRPSTVDYLTQELEVARMKLSGNFPRATMMENLKTAEEAVGRTVDQWTEREIAEFQESGRLKEPAAEDAA